MGSSLDKPGERLKTSDKDSQSNLEFHDIMPKEGTNVLLTRPDHVKATKELIDKRILAPLTLVGAENTKGNPLKGRSKGKKRRKAPREFTKFESELLQKLPTEKLAELLEKQDGQASEAGGDSIKEEIKKLLQLAAELEKQSEEEGSGQKEIVVNKGNTNAMASAIYQPAPATVSPAVLP